MNKKDFENIRGAKIINYAHIKYGCDNIHEFYLDNGMKLIFYHEDYEGTVSVNELKEK